MAAPPRMDLSDRSRARSLPHRPAWRALLAVRAEAFLRVGRALEVLDEAVDLETHGVLEREACAVAHRGLRRSEERARLASQPVHELLDRRGQLGTGDRAERDAVVDRARAVDPARG